MDIHDPVNILSSYLPHDRRKALARGESLPDRVQGAALFADISGFTSLTEALTEVLGARRGVEELSRHLNAVYDTLISTVEQFGGSVVSFAGDAIICWFAGASGPHNAAACAFAMHEGMRVFAAISLPDGISSEVAVKTSIASGIARRFVIGNPQIQCQDVLAGDVVDRMAAGEKLTRKGEAIVDRVTVESLGRAIQIIQWREDAEYHHPFAVVAPAGEIFAPVPDLQDAGHPEALPPESLRPWLIGAIYFRLQAGQGEFLTELRPAVSMFVQFSGIDYEADEAESQLDQWIRRVQTILAPYEGTLIDLTVGDKGSYLHVSFGAITLHEDDACRAVQTALEFLKIPTELPFLRPLQIGIGQGTLRTGAYGAPTRRVYGVLGDDVNLAARLMEAAHPGEILVSERVHHSLKGIESDPRPPILLKGKGEPVPVYVIKRMARGHGIRLQEPHYELPLIGRQAEIQVLVEKMGQVSEGKGQIVGIEAEAGMGKSRLVAEGIRLAREKSFSGYGGACQSGGINTPYLVWRPIWQAFFNIDQDMPKTVQHARLEEKLAAYAPHRLDALPLMGTLLGLSLPENDFTHALDPEFRKSALEAVLVDCLKGALAPHEPRAENAALLLVLEDLHWIDALSRDLLEQIARAIANLPVMMVLAYRPLEASYQRPLELEKHPAFTRIPLSELAPAELENLIHTRLAYLFPAKMAPHKRAALDLLVKQVSERAQGNPFYAEELLNYLHDQDLDPYDPAVLNEVELPNSLHQLILSRIDQLSERERSTLKVASVIGRLFPVTWLHGYYPSLGTLDQIKTDLEELHHLDLTPLDSPEPDLAYLFKHIVTQEVTYESLSYEMRARLHEHLAQYLEKTVFPTHPPLLNLLAFHYGRSENKAKQREYFQKAGEAAQAAYANDTALEYYERLFPLVEPDKQVEILLKKGAVRELTGHWEEAQADYERGLALAQDITDGRKNAASARCYQALGVMCRWRGEYEGAMEWLENARQAWETLGEPYELIQTLVHIGIIHWRKGNFASARQQLEESLRLARSLNDVRGMAFAINNLGNVAWRQGDHAAAQKFHEESLALRRQLGGKRGIAIALNNLGAIAHEQGDYARATGLYEESLALAREMGDKQGISLSLDNLGMVAQEQGDFATARALFQESLVLAWELGDKPGILSCLSNLGAIAQRRGDFVEARLLNGQALDIARIIEDQFSTRMILHNLGYIAFEQADYPIAQSMYRESLKISVEIDDKRGLAHSLLGIAGVAARQGQYERAGQFLAAAETLRQEIHQAWEKVQHQIFDETLHQLKTSLGEEPFAKIWAAGQQMSLDELLVETS